MKIEWNKVTWYSKILALALFVTLPFIGFWYGIQYEKSVALVGGGSTSVGGQAGAGASNASSYYSNIATWQTDTRPDGGFSIAYPLDFQPADNYSISPTPDWRLGANSEPGNLMLTLTIPRAFEPQTNFADAKLTVGRSGSNVAVADCLKQDQPNEPGFGTATTTINGIAFSIFKSAGAGAGNFYETTSYRTLHAGQCYAIEYTIHSSQIANFPPKYQLKPFDPNKLTDVLDRIVGTFKFL